MKTKGQKLELLELKQQGNKMKLELKSILPLAREIADELGSGWSVRDRTTFIAPVNAYLDGPDNQSIYLHFDSYRGKIRADGDYPKYQNGSTKHFVLSGYGDDNEEIKDTSIQFSPTKSAKLCASDIKRRLLPNYNKVMKRCHRFILDRSNCDNAIKKNIDSFIAASNGIAEKISSSDNLNIYHDHIHGSVQVQTNSYKLDIYVPKELGLKIASLLGQYKNGRD